MGYIITYPQIPVGILANAGTLLIKPCGVESYDFHGAMFAERDSADVLR